VNIGHGSFGLDQVCLAILTKARHYSPSVIVVEQYPWALHRVLNTYVNGYLKPYFYIDHTGGLKLQKISKLAKFDFYRKYTGLYRLYKKEFQEFMEGIDIVTQYDPAADPIFFYWKTRYYAHVYTIVEKIISVIRDYCAQINCKLLFMSIAYIQQFGLKSGSELIDYDLPAKRFRDLLGRTGVPYLDTTPLLIKQHSAESPVIFSDSHTNAKGHGVIADALQAELEARGWL
jgi:hypothetical protein